MKVSTVVSSSRIKTILEARIKEAEDEIAADSPYTYETASWKSTLTDLVLKANLLDGGYPSVNVEFDL